MAPVVMNRGHTLSSWSCGYWYFRDTRRNPLISDVPDARNTLMYTDSPAAAMMVAVTVPVSSVAGTAVRDALLRRPPGPVRRRC